MSINLKNSIESSPQSPGLVPGSGEQSRICFRRSKVIVVDVVPDRVKQVVNEIGYVRAVGKVRDISRKAEVEGMIDEAVSSQGKIDVLCNNA